MQEAKNQEEEKEKKIINFISKVLLSSLNNP